MRYYEPLHWWLICWLRYAPHGPNEEWRFIDISFSLTSIKEPGCCQVTWRWGRRNPVIETSQAFLYISILREAWAKDLIDTAAADDGQRRRRWVVLEMIDVWYHRNSFTLSVSLCVFCLCLSVSLFPSLSLSIYIYIYWTVSIQCFIYYPLYSCY